MIEWITSWAQGVIIAVIVATIVEMILPDGNCKKYIKVVIGVYILFSIISPVITKITGNGFNISEEFNLEEFYAEADSKSIYNDLNSNNSNNIKDIYITNLKTDIISKLKNKGYEVISCDIEIKDVETYEIKSLNLSLKKIKEDEKSENETSKDMVNEVEEVNSVEINIGKEDNSGQNNDEDDEEADGKNNVNENENAGENNTEDNEENVNSENSENDRSSNSKDYAEDLTAYEKNKVKEYLESTYEINKKDININ